MSEISERLERYLSGELSAADRVAFEAEAMKDLNLAALIYKDLQVRSMISAASSERRRAEAPAAPKARTGIRRWVSMPIVRWAVPAAALIVVAAIALWPRVVSQRSGVLRGPARHFSAVSPVGNVSGRPQKLVWTPHRDAIHYRVEILDVASRTRLTVIVTDTFMDLDPSMDIPAIGYWKVTPLGPDLSEVGSPILTRYRIAP